MKTFKFFAKQGQTEQVVRALHQFGKPHVSLHNGPTGSGFLVTLDLPKGVSKNAVNRHLADLGIPGAKKKKNVKIVKDSQLWDTVMYTDKIPIGEPFKIARNGNLVKARLVWIESACDCCSGSLEVVTR